MENRRAICIAMGFLMAFLSTAAVVLRFQARRVRKLSFGLDDYTILAALIFTIGLCVCVLVGTFGGDLGTISPLSPQGVEILDLAKWMVYSKSGWILQWMDALALGLTKISILLFYRRIFMGKTFQISSMTLLFLSICWMICFFFTNLLDVLPIRVNWDGVANARNSKGEGLHVKSVDVIPMFYAMTISNTILDGMILTLPWHPLWKLQMPLVSKITVGCIFLLGGFVIVSSIFRILAVKEAVSADPLHTYSRAPSSYWAAIEAGVGVICACLPAMRPLLGKSTPESIVRSLREKISWSRLRPEKIGSQEAFQTSEDKPFSTNYDNYKIYEGHLSEDHEMNVSVVRGNSSTQHNSLDGIAIFSEFTHDSNHKDIV